VLTRALNPNDFSRPTTQLSGQAAVSDADIAQFTDDTTRRSSDSDFSMAATRGRTMDPINAIGRSNRGTTIRDVAGHKAARSHTACKETQEPEQNDCLDARWRAIRLLVEKLLGGKCDLKQIDRAAQPGAGNGSPSVESGNNPPDRFGWGLEYTSDTTKYEAERTMYAAQGTITTEDGRSIDISLNVAMTRETSQQMSLAIRAGDAAIDPLMLSFDGSSVKLTDTRYAFDLNVDGRNEYIPFARTGNAFLALDLNQDGTINSGKELFGPTSGNGFAELAQYDLDNKQWIDENDAVYADLRLWSKDSQDNDVLETLAERQVGALYLGNTSTLFTIGSTQSKSLGQVVSSGLYLSEQGAAGALQQINLSA
jgi:hypothetical protein